MPQVDGERTTNPHVSLNQNGVDTLLRLRSRRRSIDEKQSMFPNPSKKEEVRKDSKQAEQTLLDD